MWLSSSRAYASWIALASIGLVATAACRDDGTPSTGATSSSSGGGEDGTGGAGQGGSSTTSTGSGQGGTPMVVANWNVRNLFDTKKDSASPDEYVYTQSEYNTKMDDVAAVLRDIDADVVILQEVENQAVLEDLAGRVGNEYVGIRLVEGNDFRGIDVGAIAKVPFEKVVSHKDDTFAIPGGAQKSFTRDCPEFHLTFAGRKFVFLGVHFRSKGGDDDPDRRLAEAFRARQIADEVSAAEPDAGVMILGDYNDLPGSPPVELIRQGPPVFLDAVDSVPEADRWTFDFQGAKELIDHQMSNEVAAPMLDTASATIRFDGAVSAASDHSPFWATYRVR